MGPVLLALLLQSPIPLDPGTWWEYREASTEHLGEIFATEEHETRFAVTGSRARPFVVQRGGVDPVSGPAESGPGWLRVAPWTGEDAIPVPLEIGRSGPAPEGTEAGWVVEAEEAVAVPAGTFVAFRCAFRTAGAVSILWIAPAVGVVREAHGPPGGRPEIERVLVRWAAPIRP
jgi:hypothetical protein